jgi:glycosyltransferase involved in cell wall biosynthesis
VKIGLFGYNTAQGLGYVNRDIASCLGIDRWIVAKHKRFATLPLIGSVDNYVISERTISPETAKQWLKGLDVLLFAETLNTVDHLAQTASRVGIKVACVPMVEGVDPKSAWVKHVSTWLAPTAFSFSQLQMLGVSGEVVYCPWPIDTRQLIYRQRSTCQRFVYAQGNGGRNDRKGGLIMAEAARLAPEIPLIVYSQVQDGYTSGANHRPTDWPESVDFRGAVSDPSSIYQDGDVFIMPSRFEGLGLQLLECQAAGMPLITTDGPPMNEANPWVRLPCTPSRVDLAYYRYASWDVSPQAVADAMRATIGSDISQASQAARDWIVGNRDWMTLASRIRSLL